MSETVSVKVGGLGKGPGERFDFPARLNMRARRNHGGQSLVRLDERGGLCWSEALAIIRERGLFEVNIGEAEAEVEFRSAFAELEP
jgi:hypothetical protein